MINKKETKNLLIFFIITLLWTWICGFIPVILNITDTPLGTFIFYFGGGAPSVTAIFLVFFTYSKEQRKDYFKRCFSIKGMTVKWTLWTIAFFLIITLIGLLIGTVFFNMKMPEMQWLNIALSQPYLIPVLLLLSLVSGPLNEEFGWRGYALDKLLVRFGFTGASIILGFIWAIWHLAWYFTPGQAQYDLLQNSLFDAIMFVPSVILLTFVVTFVYINTNRSILAGAFVHMMGNFINSQLLSPYSEDLGMVIRYVKMVLCIGVIIYAVTSSKFKNKIAEEVKNIQLLS